MNDIRFPEPVVLKFEATGKRRVASIYEAIECMASNGRNGREVEAGAQPIESAVTRSMVGAPNARHENPF